MSRAAVGGWPVLLAAIAASACADEARTISLEGTGPDGPAIVEAKHVEAACMAEVCFDISDRERIDSIAVAPGRCGGEGRVSARLVAAGSGEPRDRAPAGDAVEACGWSGGYAPAPTVQFGQLDGAMFRLCVAWDGVGSPDEVAVIARSAAGCSRFHFDPPGNVCFACEEDGSGGGGGSGGPGGAGGAGGAGGTGGAATGGSGGGAAGGAGGLQGGGSGGGAGGSGGAGGAGGTGGGAPACEPPLLSLARSSEPVAACFRKNGVAEVRTTWTLANAGSTDIVEARLVDDFGGRAQAICANADGSCELVPLAAAAQRQGCALEIPAGASFTCTTTHVVEKRMRNSFAWVSTAEATAEDECGERIEASYTGVVEVKLCGGGRGP